MVPEKYLRELEVVQRNAAKVMLEKAGVSVITHVYFARVCRLRR